MKQRQKSLRLRVWVWLLSGVIVIGFGIFMTERSERFEETLTLKVFDISISIVSGHQTVGILYSYSPIEIGYRMMKNAPVDPLSKNSLGLCFKWWTPFPDAQYFRFPWLLATGLPGGFLIIMGIRRWRNARSIPSESPPDSTGLDPLQPRSDGDTDAGGRKRE